MLSCFVYLCFISPFVLAENVVIVGSSPNLVRIQSSIQGSMNTSQVDVSCLPTIMCVSLSKSWLTTTWGVIDFQLLKLEAPCETPLEENSTHVTLCTRNRFLLSCGMEYNLNDTHVIYSNNVTLPSQDLNPAKLNRLRWRCIFPVKLLVGVHILPQISPITHFLGRQTGTGEFQVIMRLYKDPDYESAYQIPPHLKADDRVRVLVELIEGPTSTNLQVLKCWATPEQNADFEINYPLIENYCPVMSDAEVLVINNGKAMFVKWESKVFRFTNYERVYLHCNVRVCFNGSQCAEICDSSAMPLFRKRRDAAEESVVVSLGPIKPAIDVLTIASRNAIRDFNLNKSKGVTTLPNNLITSRDMFLGLSRSGIIAFSITLGLVCCIFLPLSAGYVIWKKRMKSNQLKMLSDFSQNYSTNEENVSETSYSPDEMHMVQ